MTFQKAVKYNAKGRVALVGPAGSGKSYTMLRLARLLAGPTGKIAAIDTEHGSLSKYADLFEFDVIELDSFSPDNFLASLTEAEKAGYSVFCCDSLSHFWVGKDGALEYVDTRGKRNNGDSFSGWKDFRPHERAMIDRMISSSCHVIVTMRTKNEYVTEKNDKGKTTRRKIGLAPVQREGMEYEFDLVGTLDDDNTFIVDKTRCPAYAGKAMAKPDEKAFEPFAEWLKGAARPVLVPPAQATSSPLEQPPTGPPMPKPAQGEPPAAPAGPPIDPQVETLWKRMSDFTATVAVFGELKNNIAEMTGSETPYYEILHRHGMKAGNDLKGRTRGVIRLAVKELFEYCQKCKAALASPEPEDAPFAATEDDLPPVLQGAWVEPQREAA